MQTGASASQGNEDFKKPPPPKPPDPGNSSKKRGRGRPRKNDHVSKKFRPGEDGMSTTTDESTNIYDSLTDDDEGNTSTASFDPQRRFTRKSKIIKPPPIVLHQINLASIKTIMSECSVPCADYRLQLTQYGTKLFLTQKVHYDAVKQALVTKKVNHFTYASEDDKTIKFVLYGLPDVGIDDLESELANVSLCKPTVKKMTIKTKRHEDHCLYLVSYPKRSDMTLTGLQQVRGLLGFVVKWKRFQPRNTGVTQCNNCQAFGHGSRNCYMPTSCMKCSGNHESSKCPHNDPTTKRVSNDILKCAGCGEKHSSRFKDCIKRAEFLKIRESMRARKKNTLTSTRINTSHDYKRQYPALHQTQPSTFVHEPAFPYSVVLKRPPTTTSADLFSPQECFAIFEELYKSLLSCKSKAEQLHTITSFAFKYLESAVSTSSSNTNRT